MRLLRGLCSTSARADEQKPAKAGTVEAWGRSPDNPIGGWYGLKKGLRGRFGMYIPPLMEHLGHGVVRAEWRRWRDEFYGAEHTSGQRATAYPPSATSI